MRWVLDLLALWLQDLSDLHHDLGDRVDDLASLTKYSTSPSYRYPS
jgi:hypothetical protein